MKEIESNNQQWRIKYTEKAEKDLYELEPEKSQRILKKLEGTRKNPEHYFKRLKGYDDRKLRVEDYRVIAVLNFKKNLIVVEAVGHRKNIYKTFKRRK